jgi:hypothetical protein
VFWYKAQSHKDFKIGAKEFWDAAKEAEVSDSEDDEMFDASQYRKKKHQIAINKKH